MGALKSNKKKYPAKIVKVPIRPVLSKIINLVPSDI
jgi:hypothetical protein